MIMIGRLIIQWNLEKCSASSDDGTDTDGVSTFMILCK